MQDIHTNWKDKLYQLVQNQFEHQAADHDFDHIRRVLNLALLIGEKEGANMDLVYSGALLHDISDHKLNGGILNNNGAVAKIILRDLSLNIEFIDQVVDLVDKVSFKGSGVLDEIGSLELQVVRDADRLDAIGAIGIARAFHFGGARNRPLYVPDVLPSDHSDFESYANDKSHTLNHFYEKLLLLKDRLQTKTGKEIGKKRHAMMQDFVLQFKKEWNLSEE
jgi:uncharacterized protein